MHQDHEPYFKFTRWSRLDKAVNSLLGIIEGMTFDNEISNQEISYLTAWLREHEDIQDRHPFNELFPVLASALEDGVFDEEERLDIKWLCERLRSSEYYDQSTGDMQRLHAIMGAIAADGIITEGELTSLRDWIDDHDHLKTCWPYDEVDSLVTAVMADHKIDPIEHAQLIRFFTEFVDLGEKHVITQLHDPETITIRGVCAMAPTIVFSDSTFCFTGASTIYTRQQFINVTRELGGRVINSISPRLNYLVIGADGNPCWAYSCYGRKVEAAITLRKQGHRLLLVHENDYHDAVADQK